LYETAHGWIFLAVQFDHEFSAFCKVIGQEDLALDRRFTNWPSRYEHRVVLGGLLEPVFKTRTAEEWEQFLTAADLGCVRADATGHRRFLYEDPHAKAIGFMVPTQSRAFVNQAPGGQYWRHAPVVKFSETPCEPGKPYLGLGEHTRGVLRELGYGDAAIARFKEANVIGLAEQPDSPGPRK
jgi:crotonobetainyl-CoA:carnitine CoA-transferase CaiB-like acyl-CoA transferase